jgi:hypothetical protein
MKQEVRAGITTVALDGTGAAIMREHGARSAPAAIYEFPGVSCISINEQAVHGIPGPRQLQQGDLLKLHVTVEKDGFVADAAITVPVGVASASEMYRNCTDAMTRWVTYPSSSSTPSVHPIACPLHDSGRQGVLQILQLPKGVRDRTCPARDSGTRISCSRKQAASSGFAPTAGYDKNSWTPNVAWSTIVCVKSNITRLSAHRCSKTRDARSLIRTRYTE